MTYRYEDNTEGKWIGAIAGAVIFVAVGMFTLWLAHNHQHVAIAAILVLLLIGRRSK